MGPEATVFGNPLEAQVDAVEVRGPFGCSGPLNFIGVWASEDLVGFLRAHEDLGNLWARLRSYKAPSLSGP